MDVEWKSLAMTDIIKLHLGGAQVDELSVECYWMKILSLKTCRGEIKYPELRKGTKLMLLLPFSNLPAGRLHIFLKLINTDIRNNAENVTLISLIRVNFWLKNEYKTSSTVSIPKAPAGFKPKDNTTCDEVLELKLTRTFICALDSVKYFIYIII